MGGMLSSREAQRVYFNRLDDISNSFDAVSYVEIAPQYDHRGSTSTSARVGGVLWSPFVFLIPLLPHPASFSYAPLWYLLKSGVLYFLARLNSRRFVSRTQPI